MAEEIQEMKGGGLKDINLIREKLDDVNALIAPYKLAYVSPTDDCIPLERNAHYMDKDIFDRLVDNVAEDGFLSQLPFGMKRQEDGKYLMLSGNHRLKAAIKAKLEYILILYIDEVDKDTQLGYQLSHNALVGKDDRQMLKEIYEEIQSLEKREFSGLNGLDFVDVNKISTPAINDGDIEITEMKFMFVESRANNIKTVLDALEKMEIGEESSIIVGSFESYIRLTQEVKKRYQIKSRSVAFSKMIDICEAYLEELAKQDAETAAAVEADAQSETTES
jgi:hypothetical protein